MTKQSLENIAKEISTIYRADTANAQTLIEHYFAHELKDMSHTGKITLLQELANYFNDAVEKKDGKINSESAEGIKVLSMLLGNKISLMESNLSPQEVIEKFVSSLNTIFDTLNEIVTVIHTTLSGRKDQLETIRKIIGSNIQNEDSASVQDYLQQIKDAFLIAHQAFGQAVHNKIEEMLHEFDPAHLESLTEGGLKFGPLKKAELFEIYSKRYEKCKNYFESGRLTEDFTKEFERICASRFKLKRGSGV
jgi:C-terminal domain of Type VI secretion system FHA protein